MNSLDLHCHFFIVFVLYALQHKVKDMLHNTIYVHHGYETQLELIIFSTIIITLKKNSNHVFTLTRVSYSQQCCCGRSPRRVESSGHSFVWLSPAASLSHSLSHFLFQTSLYKQYNLWCKTVFCIFIYTLRWR